MRHFDFIVLGGGSAGYAAARTARSRGKTVAIVDGAEELGGLCILRGCMPSKALLHSAEVMHLARHPDIFGVKTDNARPDWPALKARKEFLINDFASFRQKQLASDRFTLFRSQGRFCGPRVIELADGTRLTADHVMIATGSRISWPNVPGLRDCGALTSDDILRAEPVPGSAIVLGGGIVACELGQYLQRMGCQVTLIQRSPHLLRGMSPEAGDIVGEAFAAEGMKVHTGTELIGVERTEAGVKVRYRKNGAELEAVADKLLNALGREPNTDQLNLAAVGVETGPNGQIVTDSNQRTTAPGIYAGGDCSGPVEIVHTAIQQGEIAARHACGETPEPLRLDWLTRVVFTDPGVADCGLSEEAAKAAGLDAVSAFYPFNDHGKSMILNAMRGHVKVVAERSSGRILGAECVGPQAGELIHCLSVALPLGATVRDLLKAHWYHPTLAEIWTYPLEEIADSIA